MSENSNKLNQAQEALSAKIADSPSTTKEQAEIRALEAGAIESLVAAEKTRQEMRDSVSAGTRLRGWVQFLVGIAGITGTLAGVAGTLLFMDKFRDKEKALQTTEEKLGKERREMEDKERVIAEKESRITLLENQHQTMTDNIQMALNVDEVLKRENARQKTELEIARLEAHSLDQQTRDLKVQAGTLREEKERLKLEIANLPRPVQDTIAKAQTQPDSGLKEVIVEIQKPVAAVAAVAAGPNKFRAEVEKLFSEEAGVRGETYKTLTTGEDRTSQALLDALIEVGEEKFVELEKLENSEKNKDVQTDLARQRRGLENVLVTIRDISRQVTKLPEDNRNKVNAFAEKLLKANLGFGEEAESLIAWLQKDSGN